MASSTDTIGAFATNMADAELVMDIMAGRDSKDMVTLPDFFKIEEGAVSPKKIGVIREFMTSDVEVGVRTQVSKYIDKLKASGHIIEEVDLSMAKYALPIYYIIIPAEVSSNLARFDGIRYGHRTDSPKSLVELYGRSRDEGFVTENKRRIMIGSYVLSSGFFDAYYLKAQKAKTLLIDEFNKLFESYDILICTTAPTVAFKVGQNDTDPIMMYLNDAMTIPPSLAGIPAISVPAGNDENGMPVGVQLIGPMKSDAMLMSVARSMEEK
jgi:aspartyl-tRNA(Asn)/glutamyl-tRNA(Gln) amidotransferase subunit A